VPRRRLVEDGVPVTVYLPRSLVERLRREASERGYTLSQYLRLLLARTEGAQPRSEPERVQAVQPGSGSGARPSQPEAAEKQSPAGRAPSSAGAGAAAQARKHKWAFCPQCLSMYDHLGKCPTCGADLVPFGAEEGRQLYIKLKSERGAG
jgi:hypothetical protein